MCWSGCSYRRHETRDDAARALPSVSYDALVANGVLNPVPVGAGPALAELCCSPNPARSGPRWISAAQRRHAADFLVVPTWIPGDAARTGAARSCARHRRRPRCPLARRWCGPRWDGRWIWAPAAASRPAPDAHCAQIVATDTKPARPGARRGHRPPANGMSWDLRPAACSSRWRGSASTRSCPTRHSWSAPAPATRIPGPGMAGDTLCRNMIEQVPDHLAPGGTAQIMANRISVLRCRLARPGCRLARRLGPARLGGATRTGRSDQLRLLWTADAGETPEETARRGGDWLDWFAAEGITGIGMGMITCCGRRPVPLSSSSRDHRRRGGADRIRGGGVLRPPGIPARDAPMGSCCAARLSTAPVFLEERSLPGEQGWQQISAVGPPGRTRRGAGRRRGVPRAAGGCRGEVPLGTLIDLLATHHGVDAGARPGRTWWWCVRRSGVVCALSGPVVGSPCGWGHRIRPSWLGDIEPSRARASSPPWWSPWWSWSAVGAYGTSC